MNLKIGYNKLKSILGLSLSLAKADFKLRNEGSYLGVFWYLLNPALMFILLFLIFSQRLGSDIPQYHLYLLFGIIMFNFFQSATAESTRVIENNRSIIKSINFPKETLIGGIVLKNLFSHLFEILLFVIILIFSGISAVNFLYYLIILFFLVLFIFGISMIFSAITVYFIDFDNIWIFASRLLWFITPIFYSIEGQNRLFYLNLFNPMFYFITMARELIIYLRIPDLWIIFGGIFYSLAFLLAGIVIFNKLKIKFAENI